jgi:hypothetical protein
VKTRRHISRPTTIGWTTTDKAGTRQGVSHASPIWGFQNPVSRKFERTEHEKRSPITLHDLAFTFGKARASRVRARSLGVWKTCLSYFSETGFGNRSIGMPVTWPCAAGDVGRQPWRTGGLCPNVKGQPQSATGRPGIRQTRARTWASIGGRSGARAARDARWRPPRGAWPT